MFACTVQPIELHGCTQRRAKRDRGVVLARRLLELRAMKLILIALLVAGCSKSNESKSSEQATSGPALDGEGLPPECAEFKIAIAKIQSCEALPRELRARIQNGYDETHADWMKLSARGRSGLGRACKVGIDAYMTADIKKTCGW